MIKSAKRRFFGRGKGYMSASGAQSRFIVFLIFLLISYTVLLRVFQKIAEFVELPVFLPIALITLLVFIGIVGILYSHSFVGPMLRIRRSLDQLAEGETNVSLRLREHDDPVLKDLVMAISQVCERTRNSHALVHETAQELFADIAVLRDKISKGADRGEIQIHLDGMSRKKELLEKAIAALKKG